jgi:hypothetical protein
MTYKHVINTAGVHVHFYFPAGVAYLSMTGIEVFQKKNLPFSIINIFVSLSHVNPELSYKFRAAAIKN